MQNNIFILIGGIVLTATACYMIYQHIQDLKFIKHENIKLLQSIRKHDYMLTEIFDKLIKSGNKKEITIVNNNTLSILKIGLTIAKDLKDVNNINYFENRIKEQEQYNNDTYLDTIIQKHK